MIDGNDLQQDVSGWQRKIGYVPQDIYLIDDTVRRNVAFGLPDRISTTRSYGRRCKRRSSMCLARCPVDWTRGLDNAATVVRR